jgi:hypothetical protein
VPSVAEAILADPAGDALLAEMSHHPDMPTAVRSNRT